MKNRLAALLFLLTPLVVWAQTDVVSFSRKGGFYSSAFSIELSCQGPNHHIRYTLNGSTPDADALLYTAPLSLSRDMVASSDFYKIQVSPPGEDFYPDTVMKAIVIRAAVFDEAGTRVSRVVTQSYFIHSLGCVIHNLPVVSICADSLSLFSADSGIMVPGVFFNPDDPIWTGNYYQTGREWERLVNVEFYTTENEGINQMAGLRTHGGNGRRQCQKGLKLYARNEYGQKRFNYKFFDDSDISSFKHLVLKPFKNAWTPAGLQDHLGHFLARNMDVDAVDSRPVVLFLNGEYWGIYYISEKPDERYAEDHYGVDPDDVNLIDSWFGTVEEGSNVGFKALMDYVATTDISEEDNYRHLSELVDIDNFIDYQILELFVANYDWPANNMRCWQTAGRKWRWFFFDCDAGFDDDVYNYYLIATDESDNAWPTNATSTLLFRSLLKNESFVDKFLLRLNEVTNGCLEYRNTKPYLTGIKNAIQDEIGNQTARFNYPVSMQEWSDAYDKIDQFLYHRKRTFWLHTNRYFGLPVAVNTVVCYPNPVHGGELNVRIILDKDITDDIVIYDLMGKCVFRESCFMGEGENEYVLHPQLSTGTYVLKIGQQSLKFVVL